MNKMKTEFPENKLIRHLTLPIFVICHFLLLGCAGMNRPTPTSLADTDPAFREPLREPTEQSKKSWWDLSSYLDERTRQIERHLGY
jgi:hypothetical protein